LVAATTAHLIQTNTMDCYPSDLYARENPEIVLFWAFYFYNSCIKDSVLIDPTCGSGGKVDETSKVETMESGLLLLYRTLETMGRMGSTHHNEKEQGL
jgi:hypothetical protein